MMSNSYKQDQVILIFKCGYCGMEFKGNDKFMKHRKEKHCSKTLEIKTDILLHKWIIHRER